MLRVRALDAAALVRRQAGGAQVRPPDSRRVPWTLGEQLWCGHFHRRPGVDMLMEAKGLQGTQQAKRRARLQRCMSVSRGRCAAALTRAEGARDRRRLSVIATVAGAPLEEVQAAMRRPPPQRMDGGDAPAAQGGAAPAPDAAGPSGSAPKARPLGGWETLKCGSLSACDSGPSGQSATASGART